MGKKRGRGKGKTVLFFYADPIEELIGRQLCSLWRDNLYTNSHATKREGWKYQFHKDDCVGRNNIEDEFINALDLKYNYKGRRNRVIGDMIMVGFTQEEIACLLGLKNISIIREISKLKKELSECR